jgi:hypothetical protein
MEGPETRRHTMQFVTVDNTANKPVNLEVLDWGGSGRPLVLWQVWETRLTYSTNSRPN